MSKPLFGDDIQFTRSKQKDRELMLKTPLNAKIKPGLPAYGWEYRARAAKMANWDFCGLLLDTYEE